MDIFWKADWGGVVITDNVSGESSKSDELLSGNQASVYVYAARYAHARMTGAALQVVTEILDVWDRLPESVQQQLKKEAENEAMCNFEDWERLIAR